MLFRKSKSSRLNVGNIVKGWELYKEARNDIQRIMKHKKKMYFEEKLAENVTKLK